MLLKKTKVKSARLQVLRAALIRNSYLLEYNLISISRFGEDHCPYLHGSNNPRKLFEPYEALKMEAEPPPKCL